MSCTVLKLIMFLQLIFLLFLDVFSEKISRFNGVQNVNFHLIVISQ